MSNTLDTDLAITSHIPGIKTVTAININTHCIVCGRPFQVARMSKLYCSSRCKQFGYNHKLQISQTLATRERGINAKPISFFIDDYGNYNKTQKLLKRYRELEKKRLGWEAASLEIKLKEQNGLPSSNFLWDQLTGKKLTEQEEGELYDAERDLSEDIINLTLKELSLEQWSFIKSLHLHLDDISFFGVAASLSSEFIQQLSFNYSQSGKISENLIIKNKFINHCNLIATGVIKFIRKEQEGG